MISKYLITTYSGKSNDWNKLRFLSEKHIKELNFIGYSGETSDGRRISRQEYLENEFTEFQFNLECLKMDSGDFSAEFLLIVVD